MSEYDNMTVAELKELLKDAGLPVSGKKADLIARLEENETHDDHVEDEVVDEDDDDFDNYDDDDDWDDDEEYIHVAKQKPVLDDARKAAPVVLRKRFSPSSEDKSGSDIVVYLELDGVSPRVCNPVSDLTGSTAAQWPVSDMERLQRLVTFIHPDLKKSSSTVQKIWMASIHLYKQPV